MPKITRGGKMKKRTGNWYDKLTEAEKIIWQIIYYNPTWIINRTKALEMMLCAIGTGMGWHDGKIVDTIEDNYFTSNKQHIHNFDEDMYKKALYNTFQAKPEMANRLRVEDIQQMRAYNFYESCRAEFTLKNIEKLTTIATPIKSFYPISRFSNLMQVPKNVTLDWLDLCIETCNLVLMTDPLYRGSDNRLRNKNNIRVAKKQKAKLLKLKQEKVRRNEKDKNGRKNDRQRDC